MLTAAPPHPSGHFHADEALAIYLLRLLPTYTPSTLLRTRNPDLLQTCHTVVDVGGEYSPPPRNRYDHHQRGFTTTFPGKATKLSSAGLVYVHFGKEIIARRTEWEEGDERVGVLWEKIYAEFVEALDAHDNGVGVYDPAELERSGLKKRFLDGGVNLGSLVGDLNDHWDDDEGKSGETLQEEEDARFLEASTLMGTTFLRKLDYLHRKWLPARTRVGEAYGRREVGGRVMVFDRGVPWKDHLYTLETEHPEEEKVLYVLYPEGQDEGSKWRVQAVGVSKDSFESRKPLPHQWRGVRDEELDEVTGIEGCVFVHAGGFIGGNKTKEGAMEMARRGIDA